MASGYLTVARFLTRAGGKAELPSLFAQFNGYKQGRLSCGFLPLSGRCGRPGLAPLWGLIHRMEKKAYNSGPVRESADKHSIYTI